MEASKAAYMFGRKLQEQAAQLTKFGFQQEELKLMIAY